MSGFAASWVLHEDNHLLVVDKPAGLLTQDSGTGRENLEDLARAFVRVRDAKPGNAFLHAVHRIDRVASGLVVFAKTGKALERLTREVRERRVGKIYRALVTGRLATDAGELVHWLQRGEQGTSVASRTAPGAKEARLTFRVLARHARLTELEIDLHTGRHHQIRVQLAAAGHPIAGDERYGTAHPHDERIALHHHRCTFVHPVRREPVTFTAPRPAWWTQLAPPPAV